MKQRLPSVPSFQSDLLITHGDGVFISLVMQIGKKRHTHRVEGYVSWKGFSFFLLRNVDWCDLL